MNKPDIETCTAKQYEKWYWEEINESCKDCIYECSDNEKCSEYKQYDIVKIMI